MGHFNNITDFLNIYTLITFLITFVAASVACFGFLYFFFRKEIRLFKNRKRPIMIFKSAGEDMELETKLLRDSKLFNIPEEPTDKPQNIDRINEHSLIIIGYSSEMSASDFDQIYSGAKNAGIPVIIYSKNRIPENVFKKLRDYSWYSICQVPLRLLNDVFTILSTFPHSKK
ncbi:MAG: hypothetical protein Q8O04_09970 [Deltaproteobacteria bacterium]|nr:hypothetical protein [Deltaproteobacteria bacterium]